MLGRGRVTAAIVLGIGLAGLGAAPVAAHPLGNFSVNRYAALRVEPGAIEIRYVVDMAEIPTFQEMQESGLSARADHPATMAYLARQADALGRGLRLLVDGQALPLRLQGKQLAFTPGAADLPTMRIAAVYRAALEDSAVGRLSYRDENFPDRIGWREVVARAAPGIALATSSVPEVDRSRELTDYPADLLTNPPRVAAAEIVFEGGRASAPSETAPRHIVAARGAELTIPESTPRASDSVRAADGSQRGQLHRAGGDQPGAPPRSENSPVDALRRAGDIRIDAPSRAGDDPIAALRGSDEKLVASPRPADEKSFTALPQAEDKPVASAHRAEAEPVSMVVAPDQARVPDNVPAQVTARDELSSPAAPGKDPSTAARPGSPRSALTDLMARRDMGPGLLLFAMATAVVLGALHALEPGHGKTVVAAYLVGSRGTAWHAVILGLVVTVSHTAGVFLLGAVTLYASRYVMPERLYPWLGALSGLVIAGVGLALLRQRWSGAPHSHGHDHGHTHHHHAASHAHRHEHAHDHHGHAHGDSHDRHERAHDHSHDHHGHAHAEPHDPPPHVHPDPHDHPLHVHDHPPHHPGEPHAHPHLVGHDYDHGPHDHHALQSTGRVRSLLALGLSGGIVPCPGALVVLLSALAWRRLGFGILLVVAFSAGLAAVLVGIGLLMVHARRLLGRWRDDAPLTTRWLPLASSAAVTVLGLLIAVQALAGTGILRFRLG